MTRRSPSLPTLAEQRLNSAHGRLVHAAWRVPARNRNLPAAPGRWAAVDVLAHVLEFQEEALRRLTAPVPGPGGRPLSDCAGRRTRGARRQSWEVLIERLEIGHLELCRRLGPEPPGWLGELTYEHYGRHIRDLEAWHASTSGNSRF
jgi:hypothetical protein